MEWKQSPNVLAMPCEPGAAGGGTPPQKVLAIPCCGLGKAGMAKDVSLFKVSWRTSANTWSARVRGRAREEC